LLIINDQRAIEFHHIGIVAAKFVSGSVTADHNVLSQIALPEQTGRVFEFSRKKSSAQLPIRGSGWMEFILKGPSIP
jgi:hypothetical protein